MEKRERYTPPGGHPVYAPAAGDPDPFDSAGNPAGPWFAAAFESDCDACGCRVFEGDLIRADGDGGYEGQECCGDD